MNMEKPAKADTPMQERALETKEGSTEQLIDQLVNTSLDMEFPSRRPAVVAALEQAGIKDPATEGDRSIAAADQYTKEVSRIAGEVNLRMHRAILGLDAQTQEALARKFFDRTIGVSIANNANAYRIYIGLKGTPFADKFKEIESARLVASGYPGLSI